ncbi:hypothetical protein HA402_005899 [Bradysia odoriphaga]|nr:hypothetical protein HA402_005899 [Bradysia odoriphaga]
MIYGKVWAILIVFVAYLMQDTTALKCWKCASDASATKFCGRNLDTSNLTEEQKQANYVECKNDHNFAQFNAKGEEVVHRCEVYKQIINNFEEVYIRGCTLEARNAPTDKCLSAYSDTSYVKTVECKTCFSDGCNEMLDSASIGVKISKVVVVSLIVLAVLLV